MIRAPATGGTDVIFEILTLNAEADLRALEEQGLNGMPVPGSVVAEQQRKGEQLLLATRVSLASTLIFGAATGIIALFTDFDVAFSTSM